MARSHRQLLLGSLLALIAGLAAFWWLGAREELRSAPAVAPRPASTAPAAAARAPADNRADANATPVQRTAAPVDTPVPAPAVPAGCKRVHGTITVTDARGLEHTTCSGTLRLEPLGFGVNPGFFWIPELDATVTAGKWEANLPEDAVELHVTRADLDGRPAWCDEQVASTAFEQPIMLRARWLELLVRVLADDTGADLGDVRVVQMNDWMQMHDRAHPGNANVSEVVAHAKSPLQLQADGRHDQERYWMKAPGYAWNQITLTTTEPGERVLRLRPGGDVDVTIVGDVPRGAVLRVRAADGLTSMAELVPAASDVTRVDALAEGTWTLVLEKGDWFPSPLALGSTSITVTRGTIGTATIDVRADAATQRPPMVEVRGTLRVPGKWTSVEGLEVEPGITLRVWSDETTNIPLAEMTKIGDGVYRWGPKSLLCGRHRVLVKGTEYRCLVDVGPLPTEIDIAAPEACDVRVRVLDATDDKALTNADLSWFSVPQDWEGGLTFARSREVGDGWYQFTAPAGTLKVIPHADGYTGRMSEHVVQPGNNEFIVRIERACGVEITLKDGDLILPFPDDADVELEHTVSKAAGAVYWSDNKISAREPGEYLVKMKPIDGYLPVEPRRVLIEPAKWTKVEIVLQRKP